MTEAPTVNIQFEDGNLGLTTPSGSRVHAKIGVATSGAAGVPTRVSRLADVATAFGSGPLASALAVGLIESKPLIGIRVPTSVAGVVSAVAKVGAGTSVATVTGSPADAADVLITITRDAAALADATAAAQIRVNGVDLGERAMPISGALPIPGTGLTATFAAGTFVTGTTYAFTASAPTATLADITTALQAFLDSRTPCRFIHIVGPATPALAAAVGALLDTAESAANYTHAVLEARPRNAGETVAAYDAALTAEWANIASERVSVAKEGGYVYNPLTQRSELRSAAWPATMRRTIRPVGEDASRVRTGALSGMESVTVDGAKTSTPGRFITLMTLDGREGAYVAAWPTLAPQGSDYDLVQQREVIDEAARAARAAALDYLGDDVPVDTTTGRILETEALSMEAFIAGRVSAQLGTNASGVRVSVDREGNILSTRRIEFEVGVIPLGYMREITVRVGFVNPALAAVAAAAPAPAAGGNA